MNKLLWYFFPCLFEREIRKFLYEQVGQKHINKNFKIIKFRSDWGMIQLWYSLKLDSGLWTTKVESFKSFYWFLFWFRVKIKILWRRIIF